MRTLLAVLVLTLCAAAAAQAAACGGAAADPWAGSWWEPSSGLRVQVEAAGDGYEVVVGSDLEASPATQSDGELHFTHPELGAVVLKAAPDDRLQLVGDGAVRVLQRAPQHQ